MVDLLRVAAANPSPQAAIQAFDDVVGRNGDAGLALDLRVALSFVMPRREAELRVSLPNCLAKASGYYVSRDLPSFVGAENQGS